MMCKTASQRHLIINTPLTTTVYALPFSVYVWPFAPSDVIVGKNENTDVMLLLMITSGPAQSPSSTATTALM